MSFLLHNRNFADEKQAIPNEKIENFKWIFDRDDLAEFSTLYAYDKHALLKAKLGEMGSIYGLAYALHTTLNFGLPKDDLTEGGLQVRANTYGKNEIPKRAARSFFQLMWDALQDFMLLVLIVAGGVNIPLGWFHEGGPAGAVDGGAVLIAVAIVVLVTALNDYQKEKQFRAMEDKSADRKINVLREGKVKEVSHKDILVGEIVNIQQGDLIPCDGVVCRTSGVTKVTEAALTGETLPLAKNVLEAPFVVKGSQCVSGEMFIIATAVGVNTSYGKLMSGLMGNRKKQKEAEERGEVYDENAANEEGESCCPLICPNEDEEENRTPLQVKLDVLAQQVGYIGTACAFMMFIILLISEYSHYTDSFVLSIGPSFGCLILSCGFFALKHYGYLEGIGLKGAQAMREEDDAASGDENGRDEEDGVVEDEVYDPMAEPHDPFKEPEVVHSAFAFVLWLCLWLILLMIISNRFLYESVIEYFILAVTVIVVAVPEGLPLAVTISLAYSMNQMYEDNNFVRKLAACETMGNATTICSDKTGTLTTNMMSVVQSYCGGQLITPETMKKLVHNGGETMGHDLAHLLSVAIACNSKAEERPPPSKTPPEDFEKRKVWERECQKQQVLGILVQGETNQTESACLLWVMKRLGEKDFYLEARKEYQNVKNYPFDSAIKMSSIFVVHNDKEKLYRLYIKGAAERICNNSTKMAKSSGGKTLEDVEVCKFDEIKKKETIDIMQRMTSKGLRCLGFGYREFTDDQIVWTKNSENVLEPDEEMKIDEDITWLGMVGIKDPVREEVPDAVKSCQKAGIVVRMVTGDHLETAKHIAKECGILQNANQLCMTGEEFLHMLRTAEENEEKRMLMERLRVVARARPDDKEAMVEWYKLKHHDVVSVTGDGANDALALQKADVGLAMNIQGTDVAKEASDIIIMDDNFASIVKTVKWGRSVYDNIRKFVQFQLTVNYVALSLSLIASFFEDFKLPLTAVQLLWVNLIMDTLAALALATEMPTDILLERRPYARQTHLISKSMIRFILVHGTAQLIVLLVLLFQGAQFLDLDDPKNKDDDGRNVRLMTIVFNTFVWFQIFNEINARKVNGEWNVIEGFFDNSLFSIILALTAVLQFLMVQFGGEWTQCVEGGLDWEEWAFCVVVGSASFPIGQAVLWPPVDMQQGMVPVKEEWFWEDREYKEGKDSTNGGVSGQTLVHTNKA